MSGDESVPFAAAAEGGLWSGERRVFWGIVSSARVFAAQLHRLNQPVPPAARRMALASQEFNLPPDQLRARLFPRLWGGWIVWRTIPFFWRALWDLFGRVAGSTAHKRLNRWCSPSCNESPVSPRTGPLVYAGAWDGSEPLILTFACVPRARRRVLATKEAYLPLCRTGRVRTWSPRNPPHQAVGISRTKSFAAPGLPQEVDRGSEAGLGAGALLGTAADSAGAWEGAWAVGR